MWVVQDQRTPNKRAWQGRGSSKLKLRPPPGPGGPVESACRQSYIETGACNQTVVYSAGVGPRNEEISTFKFITVLPYCLKMTFIHPLLRRKRSARKGGGPRDDRRELDVSRTSRSRRPHRCRFAPLFSAIFTFLGQKVVYPLDNLGANRTNFQSRKESCKDLSHVLQPSGASTPSKLR